MTSYSKSEIYEIAEIQKNIIFYILLCLLFPPLGIITISYIYRLSKVLKLPPLKWTILMLIPFISVFALLRLNKKATNVLKANGITVGLFGANKLEPPNTIKLSSFDEKQQTENEKEGLFSPIVIILLSIAFLILFIVIFLNY